MKNGIDPTLKAVHWVTISKEPTFKSTPSTPADTYDLAVVGGGFCGLSIALHARQQGLSVLLLEAGQIGCGASGRNGGFAVPHFPGPMTPEDAIALVGQERGERLIRLVAGGSSFVSDQIRELGIACDAEQTGWIQPAHSRQSLRKIRRVYKSWYERGYEVEWFDEGELRERTATAGYLGGWYNKTGVSLNPYALSCGLARVAQERGVHIHENTAVNGIRKDAAVKLVETDGRSFRARKVAIATNGYTPALFPGLDRSVVPVWLFQVMTRPLSEDEQRIALPSRIAFTDLRKSGGFSRYTSDGRLMIGGAVFAPSDHRANGFTHARQRLAEIYPQLAGIELEHYWNGYCALTNPYLPAIQRLDDNVYALLGFSTRGVVPAQTIGRELALLLAEKKTEAEMPVNVGPTKTIFMQPTKTYLGRLAFPLFQVRDRLGLS